MEDVTAPSAVQAAAGTGSGDDGLPVAGGAWPALPLADWEPTRRSLHMWTQIAGKIRMAAEPPSNHWWHVPLYVCARGLTTSLISHQRTPFEMVFDLRAGRLSVELVDGRTAHVGLYPRSVADFYAELMRALAQLGIDVTISPRPVEVEDAVPFPDDTAPGAYDADHAVNLWLALVQVQRVLRVFAGEFTGKNSPVHLFWGAFDVAQTRFSGRLAPRHPGGVPNCPDWVMHEAYSHEVSSCGFWPGGGTEGLFYAYAYPEPPGFSDAPVTPSAARYDSDLREFVLPYEAVRGSADPDATLLGFVRSVFDAAASGADWPADLRPPRR